MNTKCAASVLQVSNVDASLKYFTEILGFTEDFRFGDYAGIKMENVQIHLAGHSIHQRPVGASTVYIFCDEVDAYFAEIKAKGAKVLAEPRDYDYGMRDCMVQDPDGNHIAFGCESKAHSHA